MASIMRATLVDGSGSTAVENRSLICVELRPVWIVLELICLDRLWLHQRNRHAILVQYFLQTRVEASSNKRLLEESPRKQLINAAVDEGFHPTKDKIATKFIRVVHAAGIP